MNSILLKFISFFALALAASANVWALSSDKDQPVSITADTVDYNFSTGERIYDGNVKLVQGSLKVDADRLVAEFEGDKFDRATATGSAEKRAVFRQRPDGKDEDVVGIGDTLIYDESNQKMEIISNAELTQANQKAKGEKIVYDIIEDKMNVKGGGVQHSSQTSASATQKDGRSKLIVSKKERVENTEEPIAEANQESLDDTQE